MSQATGTWLWLSSPLVINYFMLIITAAVVKLLGIPVKRRECLSVCMPSLSVMKMKYFSNKTVYSLQ
jgi:hypothetical protein